MPMKNRWMSVGYYQDTIHLIGGDTARKGLLKYNLNTIHFIYNQSFFPVDLVAFCQWWFQMHNVLYMTAMVEPTHHIIWTYNLVSNQLNNHYLTVPGLYQGNLACLTGDPSQSLIYYLGGFWNATFLKTMEILNISNISWSSGPNMNTKRSHFSCIVSPNKNLYAIGGEYLSSIEYISTINIMTNAWSYTVENITQPLSRTSCVMQHEIVFIIGGYDFGGGIYSDKIHVINSTTNKVSLLNNRLPYGVMASASITVNNTMFLFGGHNGTSNVNKWLYISISNLLRQESIEPTPSPSQNPTTANPTMTKETINASVILNMFEMTITKDEAVMENL